jgi:hypothetical protein
MNERRGVGDHPGHAARFAALLAERHDLVDEADVVGALGGDLLAQQQELHRDLVRHARDDARHQTAEHPDLGLGVHELGRIGRDHQVAGHDQADAAADHPALGRGDHRLGQLVGDVGHRLPHGGRRVLEIGADAEGRTVGLQDGDLVVAMLEGAVGLEQLVTQLLGQRIPLLGARHGDGGDAFAGFDFDQAHFSRPPAFLLAG